MFNLKPQTPPFTIQVEPSEYCNLRCSFCGSRGFKTHPSHLMEVSTAIRIADEMKRLGWRAKVAFGMHGEPTFNPMFLTIVAEMRKRLPKATFHVFTNGYGVMRAPDPVDYVMQMAEAGINNVLLDHYSNNGDAAAVAALFDDVVELKRGVPFYTHNPRSFRILSIPPIDVDKKNNMTRILANHCGAAGPLNRAYNNKRCAFPFRELTVRYDGNVSLCCDDFRGEYPIANVNDMPLDELWNHPRFQAARIMLYNRDRGFRPCDGCTAISMKVGFLPDGQGKETLPEITDEVRRYAHAGSEPGESLAPIVKRPWEDE